MSEQTLLGKNYGTSKWFLILDFLDSEVSSLGGRIFLAHATRVCPSPVAGQTEMGALLGFAVDHCGTLLPLLGLKAI